LASDSGFDGTNGGCNRHRAHKYIAVAVNSEVVVANGIIYKKAVTVWEYFERNVVHKWDCPFEVQCDTGGEFRVLPGYFQEQCTALSVKVSGSRAWHPQSQGLVEWSNSLLQSAVGCYTDGKPLNHM
jgi:hypothetical protein